MRKAKHYTQKIVSELVGVSESAISKIETNYQPPTPSQIVSFCRIFHTDANILLGLTNRKPIYIDDLPLSKQKLIFDVIDAVRNEHEENAKTGD